jgi:hypothetical protein
VASAQAEVCSPSRAAAAPQDSNQITYWDCTGTFTAPGATTIAAETYDQNDDSAGKKVKAYENADGSIRLDDPVRASVFFDLWAAIALGAAFVELVIGGELSLWIVGKAEPDEVIGAICLLSLVGLAIALIAWFVGLIPAGIGFTLLG